MLSVDTETKDGVTRLHLKGDLTIYSAAAFRETLLELLVPGLTLEMDLGGVNELDTAGAQLLLVAKRELAAREGQLKLHNHSPAVIEVLDLLNLAGHFGDPLLIEAH
ncbi:MAG: STAS domain-containing protein [Halothiobacillaceae bacterium]|jgi:anti-anti-sigma factor|nr:STAS domain-containing protein [Halothiobacillaceae bacterium]